MKSLPFATILLFLVALVPAAATADVTELPSAAQDRSDVNVERDEVRRLLALFRAAQLSLSEAMAIAERLHDGSRTAQIRFDVSCDRGYRVRTVKDNHVWENTIDAKTGRVVDQETVLALTQLSDADRSNIVALRSVRQELSDAVLVAEKAAPGKALGGGLMREDGKLNFVVVIVSDDHLKEVMLEPPVVGRQGSTSSRFKHVGPSK
ncbi:MAG: PepSY domain-containing protein [Bradyrhizobium sp.]